MVMLHERKPDNIRRIPITVVHRTEQGLNSVKKLISAAFGCRSDVAVVITTKDLHQLTSREALTLGIDGVLDVQHGKPALLSENGAFIGKSEIAAELSALNRS